MKKIEFEKALSNFLDDDECETASEAVYDLIRVSFAAGWKAAGGPVPEKHRLFDELK